MDWLYAESWKPNFNAIHRINDQTTSKWAHWLRSIHPGDFWSKIGAISPNSASNPNLWTRIRLSPMESTLFEIYVFCAWSKICCGVLAPPRVSWLTIKTWLRDMPVELSLCIWRFKPVERRRIFPCSACLRRKIMSRLVRIGRFSKGLRSQRTRIHFGRRNRPRSGESCRFVSCFS